VPDANGKSSVGFPTVRIAKRFLGRAALVVLILVVGVTVAAALYLKSLETSGQVPKGQLSQSVMWRVQLFGRKARGGVPDLTWSELWHMTRHQGGFGLGKFVNSGNSLDGSVSNGFDTNEDHEAGERIFRGRCAMCHGNDGGGWHGGPPLNHSGLKHGDSDLAIYKVLRDGVPGTAMISQTLPFEQRWQLVGYVRQLQMHGIGLGADRTPLNILVSPQKILTNGARPDEWLTYSGSIDGHRYTPLAQITPANVSQLRIRWIRQFDSAEPTIESTPIVVGGAIFYTTPPSNVVALDAKTGDVLWKYTRPVSVDVPTCCGRVNRGLAVLNNDVFLATLDGYLVCINANNGRVTWQTQVVDPANGYSMTMAPLIVNDSVVVGVAGGEYGIRGFLAAYDPDTGKQLWQFNTIPAPGEPGHETWQNDAWKTGGGPTWVTGDYDPSLDLIYWGVGNPSPDFSGDPRPGDNLYTNSVIALHGSTGKLAWYFQFTPHDEHDWDSAQTPVLADILINGQKQKVICWANRNGFYYVLDRATGKFFAGTPFVTLNWAKGLDSTGRPILADANEVSSSGRVTKPGVGGGTNFENPAYDQSKGLFFVPASEGASVFTKAEDVRRGDQGYYGGSGGSFIEPPTPVVRALDVATGKKVWEYYSPPLKDSGYYFSGLLATGGGLVFGASGGSVFAVDSATGREVWRVFLGGDTRAAPISFTIDGKQVIAVSAGRSLFLFGF
jgi:alcohol dehydrogenase (cytochrome c)